MSFIKGFVITPTMILVLTLMSFIMTYEKIDQEQRDYLKGRFASIIENQITMQEITESSQITESGVKTTLEGPRVFYHSESDKYISWNNGNVYGMLESWLNWGVYIETATPTIVTLSYKRGDESYSISSELAQGHIFKWYRESDFIDQKNESSKMSQSVVDVNLNEKVGYTWGFSIKDEASNEYVHPYSNYSIIK